MGWFDRDAPWHLGHVNGPRPRQSDHSRGMAQDFQQKMTEYQKLAAEKQMELVSKKLLDMQRLPPPRLRPLPPPTPPDSEEVLQLKDEINGLIVEKTNLQAQQGVALRAVIKAIHAVEGDDSFQTDELLMAIGYLCALKDPQD